MKTKGVSLDSGLSDEEIQYIEQENSFHFPPDLKSFLQYALPISIETEYGINYEKFPNWRADSVAIMEQCRNGILDGFVWQLEHDDEFWLNRWGTRPTKLAEAIAIVEKDYATAPILVPVFSHRLIPSRPNIAGNPVFSVVGVDIVCYGSNLLNYLDKEFHLELSIPPTKPAQPVEFWDDFLSQNR